MTFEQDLFELQPFAVRLRSFIEIERNFVSGSLVLALSSRFGSGKTTFLQMWKAELDKSSGNSPLVISMNSWESDYYGDPLFAIVSALVERLKQVGQSPDPLVNAAKDLGWFVTGIGAQIAEKFTGVDAVAAGDLAERKKAIRDGQVLVPKDTFTVYEGRKAAMNELKRVINHFVSRSNLGVLFLVDELDRCRPDYAIAYLETIKHIFDVPGAIFILAADRRQLENSAKMAFGEGLDFDEYFRKFVHREVCLPPISEKSYQRIAVEYIPRYLQTIDSRHCFMQLNHHTVEHIIQLAGALRMTPRQLQEMFRLLGHLLATSKENKGRLLWTVGVGSIAMTAFKIARPEIFEKLGTQPFEPAEIVKFLRDLSGVKHLDWWFILFATGGGIKLKKDEPLHEVMIGLGLTSETRQRDLSQWDWGHYYGSRFAQIYDNLNQLSQFK